MYKAAIRSGRTTRLINETIAEAKSGLHVMVICGTRLDTHRIASETKDKMDMQGVSLVFDMISAAGNITLKNSGSITFLSANCSEFDWNLAFANKPFKGFYHDKLHIDHLAIEREYSKLLDELHRYDMIPTINNVKEVLNKNRTTDTCTCENCTKTIKEAGVKICEICGYVGLFAALNCGCYDFACSGSGSNGAGCPHGGLTCPCCEDNEGGVDPWDIIKEMRNLFDAPAIRKD